MLRRIPIVIVLSLVVALSAVAQFINVQTKSPLIPEIIAATADRVEPILESMSLQQKVAQLFFIRAFGEPFNINQTSYKKLRRLVESDQIGGVIFFKGKAVDQINLTNHLQELSFLPLLVAQDMEFGAAMRVDEATRIIPAMGVAATGNPENAYAMGRITALEAKALGVHQIYAPVVDVNNNPLNPVIHVRSFSEDPAMVSEYATAFIEGVNSVGLMATAKHFPGHGDTETDSHFTLPVLRHDYARLDTVELPPFRAMIQGGIASIMSAHISFPGISSKPEIPGTLDPDILNRLLVDSLQFQGLIVSDALEMKGVTNSYKAGEAAVSALKAGIDLLLLSPDEATAISAVVKAVEDGEITEDRIDTSVRKLLAWKMRLGLFDDRYTDSTFVTSRIGNESNRLVSERIARESITLLKNEKDILPLSESKQKKVLFLAVSNDGSGRTGRDLADLLKTYHPGVSFMSFTPRTTAAQQQAILRAARATDVLVVSTYYTVAVGEVAATPGPRQRFLSQLDALKTPTLLVTLGNPYTMTTMPNAEAYMVAWSGHHQHIAAVASALVGASPIQGRLPITIPDMYVRGSGLDKPQTRLRYDAPETVGVRPDSLPAIDKIMNQAVVDQVFPGGVVAVIKDGVIVHHKAYGTHTYDEGARPYKVDDIFDLASLTKVIATTTSVMRLVSEGKIDVDDRASKYLKEFDTPDKKNITIRQMLLHESGLPAFRVYVDKITTRRALLNAILNEPLVNRPGTQYVYSDLGFISLAQVVEKVSGQSFDEFTSEQVFTPLGMKDTGFNPIKRDPELIERIPPTEIDTIFRKKTIKGEVHDERAWYMDGLAGHAGLFSTAYDIATWANTIMNGGTSNGYTLASKATVDLFTARQSVLAKRGYGFDMKSAQGFSSAGTLASPRTFGHTGFTGTSVWMDPDKNMAVIILTNRTWPYRGTSGAVGRVRSAVADAAYRSIK